MGHFQKPIWVHFFSCLKPLWVIKNHFWVIFPQKKKSPQWGTKWPQFWKTPHMTVWYGQTNFFSMPDNSKILFSSMGFSYLGSLKKYFLGSWGSQWGLGVICGPQKLKKMHNFSYFCQKRTFYKFFLLVIANWLVKTILINIFRMFLKFWQSKFSLKVILGPQILKKVQFELFSSKMCFLRTCKL